MRQFTISNIEQFKGYTFYYTFQSYHYQQGYQANPPDTQQVEKGKRYAAASRGNSKTYLLGKNAAGAWVMSEILMGGESITAPGTKTIVDVYQITGIDKGIIKLKKIKEIVQKENGQEKEIKSGSGFWAAIGSDSFTSGLAVVSLAALFILLILFMLRRKKREYALAN